VQVYAGTSGFSYESWKGIFYPAGLPARAMLRYYGERLLSVEMNGTFYRVPSAKTLSGWREEVPERFRFALKAPRKITHFGRLSGVDDSVAFFYRAAAELGGKLGAVLYQLPPDAKKDLARLEAFLAILPAGGHAAFEFRHASWFSDDVLDLLHRNRAALCVADSEEREVPLLATAPFGYLRLRRPGYDPAALASWAERILGQPWDDAYVFFKHEDGALGVALAQALAAIVGPRESLGSSAAPPS